MFRKNSSDSFNSSKIPMFLQMRDSNVFRNSGTPVLQNMQKFDIPIISELHEFNIVMEVEDSNVFSKSDFLTFLSTIQNRS